MTENFYLPVMIRNEEIILPAQLHQYGYAYQVDVEIKEAIFSLKTDERNWRPILPASGSANSPSPGHQLLQAIAGALENIFRLTPHLVQNIPCWQFVHVLASPIAKFKNRFYVCHSYPSKGIQQQFVPAPSS